MRRSACVRSWDHAVKSVLSLPHQMGSATRNHINRIDRSPGCLENPSCTGLFCCPLNPIDSFSKTEFSNSDDPSFDHEEIEVCPKTEEEEASLLIPKPCR